MTPAAIRRRTLVRRVFAAAILLYTFAALLALETGRAGGELLAGIAALLLVLLYLAVRRIQGGRA